MEVSDVSSLSREEKINILLDYAKECSKNGYKPTKRGVRRKFHLEVYNYFNDIEDYHRRAGIEVALRFFPKDKVRSLLADYVRNKAKSGQFPEFREIEKKFKIKFKTYFSSLEELYEYADVDYSLVQKARRLLRFYSKSVVSEQKVNIKNFIRKNAARGFYPSVQHIQEELNLSFYNIYDDIFKAYKEAGVNYDRPSPILLGKKKEQIFTEIVKKLFLRMGYEIKRVSLESEIDYNRKSDMTIEDEKGRKFLVEIKAYRKDYHISRRECLQLQKYLQQEKVSNGIFITTSDTKPRDLSNIWFVNGREVATLLRIYKLDNCIKLIEWIRKARVNSKERNAAIEAKKAEIFGYIKRNGRMPAKKEIERVFRIDIRSVFGKPRPYEKLLSEVKCQVPSL